MKIFMDTANVEEIREFADMGIVYGVTTNPSLIAKSGRTQAEVIPEICALIPGPVRRNGQGSQGTGKNCGECGGKNSLYHGRTEGSQDFGGGRDQNKCNAGIQPGSGAAGSPRRRILCEPLHRTSGRYRTGWFQTGGRYGESIPQLPV